ncbi:DUF6183 family protein [Streptomyces sp. NPDC002055]|uniref:DUF6183 family protein n=1 Tax=Streptomyces sp. NPDC002055 TaxID=3154534 RepID=UPI00332A1FE8
MTGRSELEAVAALQDSWDTAEGWARQGDAERVGALGRVLAERYEAAAKAVRGLDSQLGHLMRVLALTPGRPFVEQLLVLHRESRERPEGMRPRLLASLIAEGQPLRDAAYVLSDEATRSGDELRACLYHELLLRGENADELHRLAGTAFIVPEWHRLAWLPDRLADMEYGGEFPGRSYRGAVGVGYPDMASRQWVDAAARRAAARYPVHESTPAHLVEAIGGPPSVGGWGGYEVRVFTSRERIDPADLPGVLAGLPMDCVAGLGELSRFEAGPCPLDEVWQTLFATASAGGMYASGVHGAYGRLSAWRSIAGLVGAKRDAGAAEVERLAAACTWLRFEAGTEWFHNEINDYGIAAVAPGGRRIAVLAATDTD